MSGQSFNPTEPLNPDSQGWHEIADTYKEGFHPALHPYVEKQLAGRGITATQEGDTGSISEDSEHVASRDIIEHWFEPSILAELDLPELPRGYYFIGGAARAVAQRVLFGESASIRDIDIVAITDDNPDMLLADELSQRHMHDDYAYGHGIGVDSKENYFASRDLTLNEVLVGADGRLLLTKQAEQDLDHKLIRLTAHEHDAYGGVGPKMAMKMLLLEQVLQHYYQEGSIAPEYADEIHDVPPFYIALGLNKAMQYGSEIAKSFVGKLDEMGIFERYDLSRDPYELGVDLTEMTDFVFRNFASAELIQRGDTINPLNDLLDDYAHYHEYEDQRFAKDIVAKRGRAN